MNSAAFASFLRSMLRLSSESCAWRWIGSHALIARLDELAARRGYQVTYFVGWELGAREKAAIAAVPAAAWQIAVDTCGEVRERRANAACGDLDAGTADAGSKRRTSPS